MCTKLKYIIIRYKKEQNLLSTKNIRDSVQQHEKFPYIRYRISKNILCRIYRSGTGRIPFSISLLDRPIIILVQILN